MTGYILDRMAGLPKVITLKENMKPHIEKADHITYHDTREALLNDINYCSITRNVIR